MQSYFRQIALIAILLTEVVNGEGLPTTINRNVGEYFDAGVVTLLDDVERCYISTPLVNNLYVMPSDYLDENKFQLLETTDIVGCRVRVLDLNANDTGIWTLSTISSIGAEHSQSYIVNVKNPETDSIEATTEDNSVSTTTASTESPTTIIDEEYSTIILPPIRFNTRIPDNVYVVIPTVDFVRTETCYIVTNHGKRFDVNSEAIPGINVFETTNSACGVEIDVGEEQLGSWLLISKETRLDGIYERRQPFSISVTEKVNAFPRTITVNENMNFYVRLENEIPHSNTDCTLVDPNGSENANYEVDPRFPNKCGFVVKNAKKTDQGTWRILYGETISYEAQIEVTVHSNGASGQNNFTWIRDQPVQEIFGSEDAIYCKIIDPHSFVIFEGFGRCNITLPRATDEHEGTWKMFIGLSGRVLTEESTFNVAITNSSPKAEVVTEVTASKPVIALACSVSTPSTMQACKFRDPHGRILMANPGVGEDRYSFYGGVLASNQSGVNDLHCGIQIRDAVTRDLGFWRCAIQTNNETYYGFPKAWAQWLTRDPEVVAAIRTEPWLSADRRSVEAIQGDNVLMSCSIQTALRYCYFRAPNGTVYTVGPGFSSTDMAEYAGAGLDAGECSIRFRSLSENDSGIWNCNVGIIGSTEKQAYIDVTVRDIARVSQRGPKITMVVEGRQLEYCRFVRSDGVGFTHDNSPWRYDTTSFTYLELGVCTLGFVGGPDAVDRRPWTVVARIAGRSEEITRTTSGLPVPPPPPFVHRSLQTLWVLFLTSGIIMILLGVSLGSKSSRNWTYTKAASIRQSFRQRFARKAAVEANAGDRSTANAA